MRLALVPVLLALAASPARAQDLTPRKDPLEARRVEAVARGLDYLARNQRKDGSWGDPKRGVIGITSLALLGFLGQGHQEGRGPYAGSRDVLRRGVDFLMQHSLPAERMGKPTGYIYADEDRDSRMHGHGYATQVLVLVYASGRADAERARALKTLIQRAVLVIEESQTITGGWGYEPNPATAHEGSVTVTAVQALRLASDAGFVVDREVQERGLKYLRDSQKSDGSFKYSHMADTSTAALTAAALTAMHGFGEYYSSTISRGLDYLDDAYRSPERLQWPFYSHYYAAQAFYQAGGSRWRTWEREVVPHILAQQRRDGFWDDAIHPGARRGSHGRDYATAFSVLALSVADGYLPLFQR